MPRRLETDALNLSNELRALGCMRRTLSGLLLTLSRALSRTLSRALAGKPLALAGMPLALTLTLAGMPLALTRTLAGMPLALTLTLSCALTSMVLALAGILLALDARSLSLDARSLSLERQRALPLGNHAIPSIDRRRELLPTRRQLLLQIRHPLLRARRVLVRLSGVKGLGGRRRAQFAHLCGRLACISHRRLACRNERRPLQIPPLDRRGEQLARGAAGGVGGVGGVGSSGGSGGSGGGLLTHGTHGDCKLEISHRRDHLPGERREESIRSLHRQPDAPQLGSRPQQLCALGGGARPQRATIDLRFVQRRAEQACIEREPTRRRLRRRLRRACCLGRCLGRRLLLDGSPGRRLSLKGAPSPPLEGLEVLGTACGLLKPSDELVCGLREGGHELARRAQPLRVSCRALRLRLLRPLEQLARRALSLEERLTLTCGLVAFGESECIAEQGALHRLARREALEGTPRRALLLKPRSCCRERITRRVQLRREHLGLDRKLTGHLGARLRGLLRCVQPRLQIARHRLRVVQRALLRRERRRLLLVHSLHQHLLVGALARLGALKGQACLADELLQPGERREDRLLLLLNPLVQPDRRRLSKRLVGRREAAGGALLLMQQVAEFTADCLTPLGRIGGRVTHREQLGAHRVAPAVKQRLQLRGDALANEEFQVARLAGRAVLVRWDRRRRWRGRGRHGAAAGGLRNAHKSATAHPAHGTLQSL
eukprot:jgi/Chrpa1/7317/Chrysochromulina_OHIO_Genome00002328-RA